MDKSTKKLLNGTMVYFVGNALTQIISLILLRFVTGKISAEEYGIYNLVVTVTNLVIPFVTLQISDAIFKFLIKAKNNAEKTKYFTIAVYVSIASAILITLGVLIVHFFFVKIPNVSLVVFYMVISSFFTIYHRVVRALGKSKIYVAGNLIKTTLYLCLEIFLIYVFDLKAEALFLSMSISILFCLIFLEIKTRAFKYFKINQFDKDIFKQMLKFSLPLMPNAACWWLTSSVNSIIISFKCGLDVNGIYTVANKFSGVLTMVTTVFSLSWQETAISDYGTGEFKKFFTDTFTLYVKGLFSVVMVMIPFMSMVFPILIDESYYDAIKYAPFLLMQSSLSAVASFLSQMFVAKSENGKLLFTNLMGMVINIVAVLCLVSLLGLWAAVIGTILAELVIVVIRLVTLRKEFTKDIKFVGILLTFIALGVSTCSYFYFANLYNIIWFVVSIALAIILNFNFIKDLILLLRENFSKRLKK